MAKTVQLLAVIGTVKADTEARVKQLAGIAGQAGHFEGHDRVYQKRFDDGADLPPEPKKVRVTADEVLAMTQSLLSRHWDLALTVDTANSKAYANVIVDGEELLHQVPVGHLLWLARELASLRALVAALPVLNPAKNWEPHGTLEGISRADPVRTAQREKTPYNWHKENGTREHKEDVEILYHDKVIGEWTVTDLSGSLPAKRKELLLARITQLEEAVKMAREDANTAHAPDQHEAGAVFGWLMRP